MTNALSALGTDSEYFVSDSSGITSAIGLVGGTKEEPLWLNNGNIQEDNVLAEMATHPAENKDDWSDGIFNLKRELSDEMENHNLALSDISSHTFSLKQLMKFPEGAMVLGCSPDDNIYTQKQNPRPDATLGLRTASGHIHFSYPKPSPMKTGDIIVCLDYLLGIWSVMSDPDKVRRSLYGTAGSFRQKSYGGEYRVLSNHWTLSFGDVEFVWDMAKLAVENHEELLPLFLSMFSTPRVAHTINTYDVDSARDMYPHIIEAIK